MSRGYEFTAAGATKKVRQFMNLDDVRNPAGGMRGKLASIHVAQDKVTWSAVQKDTRLNYDVYDAQLAQATGNKRGVDDSVQLTDDQWNRMLDVGELVQGESYEYLDRISGRIMIETPEYLAYQSDIMLAPDGPKIITDTISRLDEPFDIAKHSEITTDKINENSPASEARRAISRRLELEDEAAKRGVDPDVFIEQMQQLDADRHTDGPDH